MPKYILNGKNYNIPDNLVKDFEKDNPSATVAYTANGNTYNIPVSERESFLKDFPDAMAEGQTKNVQPQQELQQATAQTVAQQPQQATQPKNPSGPYKPTDMERMAMGMTLGNAQYAIDNATKGIDQIEQNAKKASPFGSGNAGLGNNGNLRKGKQTFDAEKGAFVDTYLTSDGREFRDIQQANGVQDNIDYNTDVIRYQDTMKALGLNEINKDNVEQSLKEAYAERMELQRQMSEIAKKETASRKSPRFPSMVGGPMEIYPMSEDSKNLSSALRMLERRINALEAYRDNAGLVRGTTDVLTDPSSYSFGISDLADSNVMSKIKSKLDSANGDINALSDSEKAFARNYLMNQSAEQLNKDNWWYDTAGKGLGHTLSFMKDFALTGGGFANMAKAGLKAGGKLGARAAEKTLGAYMTKNLGTKVLGKTIEYLGKGAGLAAGAEAGGLLLNNTVQAASSMADIANKQMGNLAIDKDGKLDFKDSKGLGEAILTSQIARTGENASELVGLAFDAVPGILGKVIQRTTAGKALKKLTENKVWQGYEKAMNYLGIQSVWGEGMEEEYNMVRTELLNQLTGGKFEPNGSGLFDTEQQLDTWKMVGLTSMILRVPSMIASGTDAANYYGNRYNLNMSDMQMRETFGVSGYERYKAVKSMLDGADNEKIAGVMNGLLNNAQLSTDEKKSMLLYANDLVKLRGFNIGNVVAAANGYQAPPKVANYNIRGLHVDEVDKDGNVLASHDYENADDLKAGLYELQQQRFDDNLQSDISIMKTRPSDQYDQFIMDYLSQANPEMLPSEFEAILAKPSMERTEEEQQLVAPFADLLHNTVYDNTMLHEEQSQQDGEELADADSIDIEEPNEDGMNLNAQWMEAQGNRRMLFDQDENLRQEVELMESQGLSHQEIISRLDWARPEQVQGMIDYYNTKAKYEGYMNRIAQKIDEEAANSRERHTMKGTIDGVADLNNVHTITDGTNRYYLVSGDITTDPATGRITGSTSGLIIGMDLDGSFVSLNESDGYSLEPVTMSLDQFEEAERERLGQKVTQVIDPNQTMNPQVQPTEGGNVGDEAGASTGTGAYESPAPAPVTPTQPVNPPSPAGAAEQPAVTIESVTDKDGIKRYENGIAVDDAIADIQNDGFDVNEIADASIAEAQQAIDKIDKKQTKTRKDLVDKKRAQDVITYYNNVKARWAEVQQAELPSESEENVNVQPEQPIIEEKPVSSQQKKQESKPKAKTADEKRAERIKALKEQYGDDFDDDFTYAQTAEELASMYVGRNRTLSREDLAKELGYPLGIGTDEVWAETLLAKKGEGLSTWDVAHAAWQSDENPIIDNEGNRKFNDQEIHDALISVFRDAKQKSDIMDYAINRREEAARQKAEGRKRQEEEEAEQEAEIEPLTVDQIAEMEANLPFAMPVEGEDIPDSPIVQLEKAIAELQQQEGMPQIKLVDTDRMSDDEWYDIASVMYEGAFVAQEEIDFVRNTVLKDGLYIVEESGAITVYSDSQTAEELKYKVEYIKEQNNGRSNEEETGGLEAQDVQRPEEGVHGVQSQETPAAEGANAAESQGSPESVEDPYLQPRNAEEEQIIANVDNQLKGEIFAQQLAVGKAKQKWDSETAKVNQRPEAGLFGDNIEKREKQAGDQLEVFEGDNAPAVDASEENLRKQVKQYEDAYQHEKQKLEKLQSEQERNSRIRGALDNHRRQTKIETKEQPTAYQPKWQYQFHYNKETGRAWITRDDVSGPIPLQDGRFYIEGKSLAELRGILENPANNLGELLKEVEAQLHNAEVGEQIRNASTPTEAIELAAQQFRKEQEEKKAYGADNKLVTQDRYEQLKKRMKQKLLGQANMGFDPEIMQIGAEMAMFHIEAGARKFADYATRMINDLGDAIRPYLQGFYEAARRMPGMEQLRKEMDSTEFVDNFDVLSYDKQNDNTVNVNKQENNEPKNSVSLQQEAAKPAEELAGDSAEYAEQQEKIERLRNMITDRLRSIVRDGYAVKPLSEYKRFLEIVGIKDMSDTDLQEIIEACIVDLAREFANNDLASEQKKFNWIVKLYNGQPSLNARDNDRINKQQYSTPAPMAYLMGLFVDPQHKANSGLEPSAGNGMLTIALPKEKMHVNDIDEMRLSNLQKQGFGQVTSQDGLQPFEQKAYDVVVTNPPFGNVTPKVYDGIYEISGLEHQMAINALESMKDDGRAAIIIGGNTEYNQNGSIKGKDRIFLNYLYSHYNVVDVINMDGKTLYSRQGTGYPVRMILINGRKELNPKGFAPVQSKARAEQVKTYDELYKRISDDILSDSNKTAGVHNTESGESNGNHDSRHGEGVAQTGVRNVQPRGSVQQHSVLDTDGSGVQRSDTAANEGADTQGHTEVGGGLHDVGSRTETSQSKGSEASPAEPGGRGGRLASGGMDSQRQNGEPDVSDGVGQRGAGTSQPVQQQEQQRGLSTEKVPYKKQSSNPFTLDSLMPAEQADEVKKILEELGDVDQFLVDELGYANKEELHKALAAEQIDSVAMAIHQMNQGNAFIIGDMTGIGKGRQAAALIRYGVKKGGNPVFITVKKGLFSDMYRDLCDIGSPGLRPFIWCAKDDENSQDITDADGNVVYKWNKKEQERVVAYINEHGKLPPEYDYVVTTYDGFKSGTKDYEDGKKTDRKFGKNQKPGTSHFNGQAKRDALEALAENSYVIMDESHNAGGDKSNVSKYLQYITVRTKGTTFLSATFAKRPENMPIYALRTAISKAGVKVQELIDAVKRGGATFQEVMSKALTGAGQMIRRERNMEGVTIDWKGIDDESVVQQQREQYDKIIGLFNDIINFQRTYVDPIVNGMNDAAAEEQGEVEHTPGTRDMGINNTPFASRTYNIVQQVLLSLKAQETAKRAIEHLKAGRKPVIAVANTNEKASEEATGSLEEDMEMPDLSVNLKKGLQGTMRITKTDANGNEKKEEIPFDKLSEEGQVRYREIMDAIENASTGLSLSPIDVIKNELKKAGYKVGELTGRKAEFVYNEDGTVKRVKRQDKDKKRTAADFNNGTIDALVINRSAGTGISLHASTKFKDQRQRIMLVAQAQGDVNDEVQMRGRIDRTGQVLRGMYEYVVSQIPSEQRLLMMLKAKLRSLDANTTSSQKSKFNEMQVQDIINKYGDEIVIQYLAENPELAAKMVDPLKWGEGFETLPADTLIANASKEGEEGKTASKVLGRMALLTVKEQEKMLKEIGDMYQAEIDRLNEMGENDLEITEMPLKAKTLSKAVWETGVEPGGKNPFADNSYVEEVEMDILKKPMKAEEVKRTQERLLGGKTWNEYKQGVFDKVDKWAEQKKAETTKTFTERAEKKATAEKEKYAKGAKKAQEKNGMTDDEIEKNAGYQYDTFYKQEMEKLKGALEAIDRQKQAFVDAFETFSTDGVYALPKDIYDLSQLTFEPSFGKVIDIKVTDNFSTNASTITFATLDGRRKITIPINGLVKQNNGEKRDIKPSIVQQTAQSKSGFFGSNIANMIKMLEQNVDNWDKLTSTATRKKGYIITGNLLKALTSLRSQGKGGKLISYTTDTGEIRQGVLMSDNFDPSGLTSKSPISSAKDKLNWAGDKIVSADKEVTVKKNGWGPWYELKVPKSNKRGAKYYNDDVLLSLMEGQFSGSTQMTGDFKQENLDAVLKRLDQLGVTVTEERNTEDTPKRMITSHDPMEAINQAAEDWRRERKTSSISNKAKEVADFINNLSKRFGIKGGSKTYVINSVDDIEALRGTLSDSAIDVITNEYNEPDVPAAYLVTSNVVVIFGEKVEDVKDAEVAYWHEQAHSFWSTLPEDVRNIFGEACFNFLKRNYPLVYRHIKNKYSEDVWLEEACSFLMGEVVAANGTAKLLNDNFAGNEIICNFANGLRNYIKYGKQERNNQLRRDEVGQGSEISRRSETGQGREGSSLRPEEEQITDPIEAIERSAKRWRREREERAEDIRDVDEYSAKQVYHERIDRMETMFTEAWQDDMVTFKAGQNAIAHDEEIPDSQNAYQAMNLSYGKTFTEQEQFANLYKQPLLITVNKILKKMGWRTGDVDRYLFTKHGLERNRELFVRDWLQNQRRITPAYEELSFEEQDAYDRQAAHIEEQFEDGDISEEQKNKKLDEALRKVHQEHLDEIEQKFVDAKQDAYVRLMDGEITFADYLREVDDFIMDYIDSGFNAEEHDYSGFTEMYGDEEGKFNESEIVSDLMADEDAMGEELQKELWSRINNCSQYGLEKYRTSGMTSDETSKRISDMFHWYVPMRGFNEGMAAQDHWQYMTVKDGASRIGGLLKKAKGRRSEAGFPLATLFGMTNKAISDANQNDVKKHFWRLVQAHPNDLVVTSDSWVEYEPSTGEWVVSYPPIDSDMTGPMVAAKVKEWQERMRQAEQEGTAKKLKGKVKFDYKVDKERQKEHIVEVLLNGERKLMIVTGNPRMAQAINGQLHYQGGKGAVSRALNAMKQFMQSVSTSFNLTFVGRNMARDWTHFGAVLSVREGMGYETAAQKYYWEQLPKMISLFKKYRSGNLDMSNEMERDFKDFMDNGGITGFVHMQKVEAIQNEMQKFMEEQKSGKMIRLNNNAWTKILDAIEAMNEAVENNARFATYRASRHYAGRTKSRSAYDAKEVTVNFNKKGSGRKTAGFKTEKKDVAAAAKLWGESGQILAANKMFFNATIQAICTIFKNTQNKDGSLNWPYINKLALRYALPPFIMALAMPLINQMLMSLAGGDDGDDPYANLPEWTRRKAICLYMGWVPGCGKQDFLILPIGQELAAFYSLGDMLAGKTYANELEPLDKDFTDEMLGFFNVFSPVDFDTKITSDDNTAPISEYVGRVYSVAAPLVAIGENMSWNGRPIFREDKYPNDKFIPEYKMAYNSTNSQFVAISKWLNDITGGDDVSRGAIQINPATMQYLVEQYTGGPGKLFANTFVSAGKDLKNAITGDEVDFNIRKLEGVRAFWQQGDDRTQFYRTQAKYRKYKAESDEFAYKMRAYQKDAETNPEHYMKLMELVQGDEAARYGIIHEVDATLRELNTAANEATGRDRKNIRSLYNEQLKYVVDELDKVKDIPEASNQ